MAPDKRETNERKFGQWEPTAEGRRYWLSVAGRHGRRARYVKEVDGEDNTLRFYQEIYDDTGRLVEIHRKYPVDEGHVRVEREE
jgi:hypothetical protein